ncbi:hypothetical protein KC19_11G122900 [Ceratodon purpureus]|uniref:Uncharacterized protein n=1 Tax=Ceratodon purpureus TaxID=3225 RepID=A0A8T0GDM8_CERPU|nr:hypothetical protein KC19_11G122900 [Ceratodon purpureus]
MNRLHERHSSSNLQSSTFPVSKTSLLRTTQLLHDCLKTQSITRSAEIQPRRALKNRETGISRASPLTGSLQITTPKPRQTTQNPALPQCRSTTIGSTTTLAHLTPTQNKNSQNRITR